MNAVPSTRYASRRGSTVLHVVTGVTGWYSGMALTAECGVRRVDVLDSLADRDRPDPRTCKRCAASLGWPLTALSERGEQHG